MRRRSRRRLGLILFASAAVAADGPRALPHGYLLPNGWTISPAGQQIAVGGLPLKLAPMPDGRHVLVMSNGYTEHFIGVLDVASGAILDRAPMPKGGFLGLAISPDAKTVYASGAGDDRILIYRFAGGRLSPDGDVKLNSGVFPAGLCTSRDGDRLYAVGNASNALHVIDTRTRAAVHAIRVGYRPYTCAVTSDGATAYVSNWGEDSVAVVDLGSGTFRGNIRVREKPNDLALSRDGRLFVANGNRNTVTVIDTAKDMVAEELDIALVPDSPPGSTPNALALTPDGKTLYVASADNNAVAVIDISERGKTRPRGFIPTGWYPSAVAITPDGATLVVGNGKGGGSRENASLWTEKGRGPGYVGNLMPGTLSVIPVPDSSTLARYSQQAQRNSPYANRDHAAVRAPFPLGDKCPIRHVVYIIKENRTYDQILGDMKEGNGDPNYCLFPEEVTPNHHKLARDFVLLDNVYHDAEVSADGHHWVTSAYATDYVEKLWPGHYGGFFRGKRPDDLHDDTAAFSAAGFIWDLCTRAGLSYRSYGEFARRQGVPDGQVRPATPSLAGHVHPTYYGASGTGPSGVPSIMAQSDLERFDLLRADLREFERKGEMPRLIIMSLPGDHTMGTAAGALTPRAFLAANDLALGKIVEAISNSRFWNRTAIFVIEDDTQAGPDHVDVHRTPAFVISPYARRLAVDHTMYSSSGMLRTIELVLGLPPLTQYDAAAAPMWGSFQSSPNFTPYGAVPARVPLDEKNTPRAYRSRRSLELLSAGVDTAPDHEFNDIIWKAVKGRKASVPPRRIAAFVSSREEAPDE